jgi:hypothetical protein
MREKVGVMPSGGSRQGTPGQGYINRTDLAKDYKPRTVPAPTQAQAQSQGPQDMLSQIPTRPDDVPNLGDPTNRPDEPVTSGIGIGPGGGREMLGQLPQYPSDPTVDVIKALMIKSQNPDLVRLLFRLRMEGRE